MTVGDHMKGTFPDRVEVTPVHTTAINQLYHTHRPLACLWSHLQVNLPTLTDRIPQMVSLVEGYPCDEVRLLVAHSYVHLR